MFNYFISLIKHLPEIRYFEHHITERFYWRASPDTVKEVLQGIHNPEHFNTIEEEELILLVNTVKVLKGVFKKMPLKLQLEHIFDINSYKDTCTYFENYKINCIASQLILINHFMMSYAEIILPKLDNSSKKDFLNKLESNLHKGGWMGGKFYEEDHIILINKWMLESELPTNSSSKKKIKL